MIYTLNDAKTFCAPYIDGGRQVTDPKVVERINEAEMILLQEVDGLDLTRLARFYVDNTKNFTVPECVESVIAVNFNGVPGKIRGPGYEFLSSGPGPEADHAGRNMDPDLRDLGDHYPTFYPIGITPRILIAISDDDRDFGSQMRIRGYDSANREINHGGPGELLNISKWQSEDTPGTIEYSYLSMTSNEFQEITSIVKPETYGYVSFYAFDPETYGLWFLSRYAPHETQPGYRRYEILNKSCDGDVYIHALCRLRHVPLRNDSDPLTIQNVMALRWMCKFLHETTDGNMQKAEGFKALAIRQFAKQNAKKRTDEHIIEFDIDMSPNSIPEI